MQEKPLIEISWWEYSAYLNCPQQHDWIHRIKKEAPVEDNKVYALYGLVIQQIFEWYINEKAWKLEGNVLTDWLENKLTKSLDQQMKENRVVWNDRIPSKVFVWQEVRNDLDENIKTWKMLGWGCEGALAELDIAAQWGKALIKCRPDFIVPTTEGIIILDGKGSKYKRRADPTQLKWNALVYHVRYGKRPVKLAFYHWRMQTITWVPWDRAEEHKFGAEVLKNLQDMLAGNTKATPSNEACKYCNYTSMCQEYQFWRKENPKGKVKVEVVELDSNDGLATI